MNREDRAKIFMAFDALKGLREELELREKRHARKERIELSETQTAEISNCLKTAKPGETVCVVYYSDGNYVETEGPLNKIDKTFSFLVVGEIKVAFENIFSVKKVTT